MRFSKFLKILSIAFFILGCVFLVLNNLYTAIKRL